MIFWDASAIVPLLVEEPRSEAVDAALAADREMITWWATPVECASGLVRLALAAAPIRDTREPARGKPRLELSEARRDGGRVAVSFRLANVLGEEALERMRSGVPVVYRHRVEVLGRRSGAPWPSKEHASMRIVTSAAYDSLTQRYELLRTIELGQRRDRGRPPLEQRTQTDSIESAI